MLNFDHFVRARATFCRDLASRRADRFDRPIRGPQFDHEAMMVGEIHDAPAPPIMFHLVYRDAKGDLSGRCVTLRNAKREVAEVRLTTFCHYRVGLRVFLASRVVEATDLATGEVFEDGLDYFLAHPMIQAATPDALANLSLETLALQECRDEVILLSFVAAADDNFDENERDEIVKHVMNRCPDEGLSENEVRRRVRSFVPDERAFEQALSRLCAGQGDARALMRSMRKVIDADGDYDLEEMAFANEIERRLAASGRL